MTLQYQEAALKPQMKNLVGELRGMIDEALSSIASTINSTLTLLYWRIGNRIHKEILQDERAAYGESIVASVSRQLTQNREKLHKAIEHARQRLEKK